MSLIYDEEKLISIEEFEKAVSRVTKRSGNVFLSKISVKLFGGGTECIKKTASYDDFNQVIEEILVEMEEEEKEKGFNLSIFAENLRNMTIAMRITAVLFEKRKEREGGENKRAF